MSIRLKEWLGRLSEIAANFILPGLGGLIFDRGNRKNAIWQVVLSVAGIVLAGAGASAFLAVFMGPSGLKLEEEYVAGVLQDPEELYQIMMGLAGVIFGGILVLGGFLWSLENAMKRWRSAKPDLQPPALPEEK